MIQTLFLMNGKYTTWNVEYGTRSELVLPTNYVIDFFVAPVKRFKFRFFTTISLQIAFV